MTLSKDQKRHRQRQKQSQKDYKRNKTPSGYTNYHVTKRNITVRISESAYQKLQGISNYEGITKAEMLTHLLTALLPKYSYNSCGDERHQWIPEQMDHDGLKARRRAPKESRKLSYWITSTAWNKLHVHKKELKMSKSRIVESLILNYEQTTHEHRQMIKEKAQARLEAWTQPKCFGLPEGHVATTEEKPRKRWVKPDSQCSPEHLMNRILKRTEGMSTEEFDQHLKETFDNLNGPILRSMEAREERHQEFLKDRGKAD